MDMLEAVKKNLNIDFCDDDEFIKQKISAAVNYAEDYQHVAAGYYSENIMPAATEQAVVMLASHFYESRDGSTGGFWANSTQAADKVYESVNALLRLGRDWQV